MLVNHTRRPMRDAGLERWKHIIQQDVIPCLGLLRTTNQPQDAYTFSTRALARAKLTLPPRGKTWVGGSMVPRPTISQEVLDSLKARRLRTLFGIEAREGRQTSP